ncbi:hypothetical protein HRJ35_09640 [Shewanella oneidensis MR-1]|uniref:hypothetical protein n=1 Tax=Shewanella oneidensis TaxID=70863 RepID=UPI0013E8EAE4|nr:hypothetical protein [Shewanella oneidensis]MDX5996660.1 hypothetical protein [Shewanella oneidensis]QKG96249.1 hypothetical protein HRJ35_09640 [Shewanella oneidensis MR-1]
MNTKLPEGKRRTQFPFALYPSNELPEQSHLPGVLAAKPAKNYKTRLTANAVLNGSL